MNREIVKREKRRLDKIVGENIRMERELRNMTREELGELLELTTSHVGLIERGDRGATAVSLMSLSQVFNAPLDRFFEDKDLDGQNIVREKRINAVESRKEKIITLLTYLGEKELDFVTAQIRALIAMNYGSSRNRGERGDRFAEEYEKTHGAMD